MAGEDPAVAAYLASAGEPDFVIMPGRDDVELVYTGPSRIVHFHRPAGSATVRAEVSPIPTALLDILPADLRAGTSGPVGGAPGGCWSTAFASEACRTCCKPVGACAIDCRPPAR